MKVSLIDSTKCAMEKLIMTKNTRLNLTAAELEKVFEMPREDKLKELEYMAKTIPSSWEFVSYTFLIEDVSRGFTHQFVRNRHGSFAQQTMRMVNMEKFTYHTPPEIEKDTTAKAMYEHCMEQIQEYYNTLLKLGIKTEDARGVLPTNIHTNIVAQFNLRTLAEIARARTGWRTQEEYRGVVEKMIACVIEVHPWTELFLKPDYKDFELLVNHFVLLIEKELMDHDDFINIMKFIDRIKKDLSYE
jgi:thymidylate synthase (FAD)